MTYLEEQTIANFYRGDWVIVIRSAMDHEGGWGNTWAPCMTSSVGRSLRVENDSKSSSGITLSDGYTYPYFVLKRVQELKLKDIKVGTVLIRKEKPGHFYIVETISNENVSCRTTAPSRAEHNFYKATIYELSVNFEVVK